MQKIIWAANQVWRICAHFSLKARQLPWAHEARRFSYLALFDSASLIQARLAKKRTMKAPTEQSDKTYFRKFFRRPCILPRTCTRSSRRCSGTRLWTSNGTAAIQRIRWYLAGVSKTNSAQKHLHTKLNHTLPGWGCLRLCQCHGQKVKYSWLSRCVVFASPVESWRETGSRNVSHRNS